MISIATFVVDFSFAQFGFLLSSQAHILILVFVYEFETAAVYVFESMNVIVLVLLIFVSLLTRVFFI